MSCSSCGASNPSGARFCTTCGRPLAALGPSRRRISSSTVLVVGATVMVASAVVAGLLVGPLRPGAGSATNPAGTPASAQAAAAAPSPSLAAASPSSAAAPSDLAALYRDTADGVVRIETTDCDGGGVGSGFLVAPDVVATVAHVVDGARTIAVRDDDADAAGVVIGIDRARDLALVELSSPLGGHVFTLAGAEPDVGTTVAAIGYPLAGPRSLSRGLVSGLNRSGDTDTAHLTGLIQTDAAINPGNSGGPLLDTAGSVVGLVDAKAVAGEGIGYAIPAATAAPLLRAWQGSPRRQPGGSCGDARGSTAITADVSVDSDHPDAPGIANTFASYATGIDTGDYDTAYDDLDVNAQAGMTRQEFADSHTSSYVFDLHLEAVTSGAEADDVTVRFTSVQDQEQGRNGQACSLWRIRYRMVPEPGSDGHWLIDRAVAEPGYPRACDGR